MRDVISSHIDVMTARFILLEDCGHVVEVSSMDNVMDEEMAGRELKMKSCPECHTPVLKSGRYGNVIKETLKLIDEAKDIANVSLNSRS